MKKNRIQSVYRLHKMLGEKFGGDALSSRSLATIMNKKTVIRSKAIQQLSSILKVHPSEFIKDTDIASHFKNFDSIKIKYKSKDALIVDNLSSEGSPFSKEKLYIYPNRRTPYIENTKNSIPILSFYVLRGILDIVFLEGSKKIHTKFKGGDSGEFFNQGKTYFLGNKSKHICIVLVICFPPHSNLQNLIRSKSKPSTETKNKKPIREIGYGLSDGSHINDF